MTPYRLLTMKSLKKILAIDIGAGTQDILLYDSKLTPENCISMILPSPSKHYAHLIEKCDQDLYIEGDPIGGGALPSLLKKHIKKGFRVIMNENAAYTVRNNLNEVKEYGIEIGRIVQDGFQGKKLKFNEIDLSLLKNYLANYGERCDTDLVAIAVQDHGIQPEGTSNRVYRFKVLEDKLKKDRRPVSFVYAQNEIPEYFRRMRAVAHTAMTQLGGEVLVMDTSFAAILGCLEETHSSLFVNVGNNHTLAAIIIEGRVEGLMEHHTINLNTEKLDELLVRFVRGEVTSEEILEDGGHGAVIFSSGLKKNKEIIVTGPHRELLKNSRLNVRFAAPHGNMMLTGPFGLVKAAHLKYGVS